MEPTQYGKVHLVEDYALNLKMVLAMQQLGCGQAGTLVIWGMLSIYTNRMGDDWTQIEEEIKRQKENPQRKSLPRTLNMGKIYPRLTRTEYRNSAVLSMLPGTTMAPEGAITAIHHITHLCVGNRSKKVIGLHYMLYEQTCKKCEKDNNLFCKKVT
jgi:hypothetical protein